MVFLPRAPLWRRFQLNEGFEKGFGTIVVDLVLAQTGFTDEPWSPSVPTSISLVQQPTPIAYSNTAPWTIRMDSGIPQTDPLCCRKQVFRIGMSFMRGWQFAETPMTRVTLRLSQPPDKRRVHRKKGCISDFGRDIRNDFLHPVEAILRQDEFHFPPPPPKKKYEA